MIRFDIGRDLGYGIIKSALEDTADQLGPKWSYRSSGSEIDYAHPKKGDEGVVLDRVTHTGLEVVVTRKDSWFRRHSFSLILDCDDPGGNRYLFISASPENTQHVTQYLRLLSLNLARRIGSLDEENHSDSKTYDLKSRVESLKEEKNK